MQTIILFCKCKMCAHQNTFMLMTKKTVWAFFFFFFFVTQAPQGKLELLRYKTIIIIDDGNTEIFHVFEMRIGMNEFDHRILALLQQ